MRQYQNKMSRMIFVIFVVLLICITIYGLRESNKAINGILENPKYTVGLLGDYHYRTTTEPPGSDYKFYLNNIQYEQVYPYSNLRAKPQGDKYVVVYDSLKPEYNYLLYVYSLPDDISIPVNG